MMLDTHGVAMSAARNVTNVTYSLILDAADVSSGLIQNASDLTRHATKKLGSGDKEPQTPKRRGWGSKTSTAGK